MKTGKSIVVLGIGTIILSLVGFYNGYPLVYSDTGTYIHSGFEKIVPFDRPIAYGLFLRFFSFKYSAWLVILFQNLITAYVVWEFLKVFFNELAVLKGVFLSMLLFLVMLTGIGWYSNQLMPDFFAPLLIISFFTLIVRKKGSLRSTILLSLILLYAMISHFSHLMIGFVLVLSAFGFKLLLKQRLKEVSFRRIVFVGSIVLSAWFVLPTINYLVEKEFALSKGSHVFLMAHLADTGILNQFLNENCHKPEFKDCKLCAYKDALPTDATSFIWSGDILKNTGGWVDSKDEYSKIISATLTQPKYFFANVYKSITYGFVQMTDNYIGHGLSAYNEGSSPYGQIHWRFHHELNNYKNSRQNLWNGATLHLEMLNDFGLFVILLFLFIAVLTFASPFHLKLDNHTILFLGFAILSIALNSFITAGLNSPYGRLQTRVNWLLPMSVLLLLIKNHKAIFGQLTQLFKIK